MEHFKISGFFENFVEPGNLDYLIDHEAASRLVEELRWRSSEKNCPKCGSKFTRQVNTLVFRELFRCIDCGYQFNNFSGTIFQGTRIPLVKHFHLFMIFNALSGEISVRDVSYVLDVSYKTASSLVERMGELPNNVTFTRIGCSYSLDRLLADDKFATKKPNIRFFEFSAMKGIYVTSDYFRAYLLQIFSIGKLE